MSNIFKTVKCDGKLCSVRLIYGNWTRAGIAGERAEFYVGLNNYVTGWIDVSGLACLYMWHCDDYRHHAQNTEASI